MLHDGIKYYRLLLDTWHLLIMKNSYSGFPEGLLMMPEPSGLNFAPLPIQEAEYQELMPAAFIGIVLTTQYLNQISDAVDGHEKSTERQSSVHPFHLKPRNGLHICMGFKYPHNTVPCNDRVCKDLNHAHQSLEPFANVVVTKSLG